MAESESLQSVAQTPAPLSTWFGVVLLFFLFGIVVFAVIGPAPRGDNYEQTRAKKRAENLKTLHEEQSKALTSYAWVDKNKGTVRIPIEQAIQLTIAELSSKKVAPGGPIVVAAPAAPAGTQPGANASPAAAPAASTAKPAVSPGGSSPSPSPH